MTCTTCHGSGQCLITVVHIGADGTPYQGVEHQPCPCCQGTGRR